MAAVTSSHVLVSRKSRPVISLNRPCSPAPTGLCPKAQGCAERATLGHGPTNISNRNAVVAIPTRAQTATTSLRLFDSFDS